MGIVCRRRLRYCLASNAALMVLSLCGVRLACETLRAARDWSGGEVIPGGARERQRWGVDRCDSLSIVCAADRPPTAGWPRRHADTAAAPAEERRTLRALRSSEQHVLFAGHSRLRQVFEQLQLLLAAPLRTRADRPPPLPDRDGDSALPLPDNSTCIAAFLKPSKRDVWCSLAADWGQLLLDFRWRQDGADLSSLLATLAARPPDRLIIIHGLYQQGSDRPIGVLNTRSHLVNFIRRLRVLQRHHTDVHWMLEAGLNQFLQTAIPGDGVQVVNALITELALEAGVPLWSAHLPLVEDWLNTDCREPDTVSGVSRTICEHEQVHADPHTSLRIARQLVDYMMTGSASA